MVSKVALVGLVLCGVASVGAQCTRQQAEMDACVGRAVGVECQYAGRRGEARCGLCRADADCGVRCARINNVACTLVPVPPTPAPSTSVPETVAPPTPAPATPSPPTGSQSPWGGVR
eukprot:TRINITY_DN10004_c0_g1_i1.p2 TRINITY_DN10004_c0_g1~~TRINITY_DN10004_c0_g1_i1.p2  ORF type:complete len:117 (+),score=17.71 TRINITY_DN10004_c0_g1_i1:47-397(+)